MADEFRGAELRDKRLTGRLVWLGETMERSPGAGFPQMTDNDSELGAIYRFLNNDKVSPEGVLKPHIRETLARAKAAGTCLVVHDTTEFDYPGGVRPRKGLGRTGSSKSGFLSHMSLVVSADGGRVPLGVLAVDNFARTGEKAPKKTCAERRSDDTRESLRWDRQFVHCEDLRAKQFEAVHLCDREADIYRFLASAEQRGSRYVVRAAQDRRVSEEESEEISSLFKITSTMEAQLTRVIELSERADGLTPSQRKRYPKRKARLATVAMAGKRLTMHRPRGESKELPKSIELGVVRVWELDVPEGEPPVEWLLLTREPLDTAAQVETVVDWYRARWVIEEFFKVLKTGCSIEKRQLETYEALVNALAVFLPIGWRMLLLRALSRVAPDEPARLVINEVQETLLRDKTRRTDTNPMTVLEALYAIASLGGHLKRNGAPGWLTIGRGFQELLLLEVGFRMAVRIGAAGGPPPGPHKKI